MEPTSPSPLVSPSPKNRNYLLFGGIGAAFLLFWAIFWLAYFGFIPLTFIPGRREQKAPSTPASATPPPVSTEAKNLETCAVAKAGNPLVDDVRTLDIDGKQTIVGTFRGNINKYQYDSQTQSASLELISPRGEQFYTFKLKEEEGLVHDALTVKDVTLAQLRVGQTVVLSFNCFPEKPESQQFRITRVAITGKT